MGPLVILQVTRLRESLVKLGAGIRFLPSVNSYVDVSEPVSKQNILLVLAQKQ